MSYSVKIGEKDDGYVVFSDNKIKCETLAQTLNTKIEEGHLFRVVEVSENLAGKFPEIMRV